MNVFDELASTRHLPVPEIRLTLLNFHTWQRVEFQHISRDISSFVNQFNESKNRLLTFDCLHFQQRQFISIELLQTRDRQVLFFKLQNSCVFKSNFN